MTMKEPGGPFSTKLGKKKYHVVFIRQCDTEPKAGNYVYRLLYWPFLQKTEKKVLSHEHVGKAG